MSGQRFFYLKQNGRIFGPFPAAHILKLFRSDALHEEDEISVDKVNWKNALQFFNVPTETVVPLELPGTQNMKTRQSDRNIVIEEMNTVPSDIASAERCGYSLMQHLYIIFAAVMLLTVILSAGIYSVRGIKRTNTAADVEADSNESEKVLNFEPAAVRQDEPAALKHDEPAAVRQEEPAAEEAAEREETVPVNVNASPKKVSSAFILTVFRNMN